MLKQPSDPDCLETLCNIFDHASENSPRDCSKIIDKILKSTGEFISNENQFHSELININKAFSSIKVLLKLYEKLCSGITDNESKLSLKNILENLKHILENYNDISDNHFIKQDILIIINTLWKIIFLQGTQEDIFQLAEFYQFNLNAIIVNASTESFNLENLTFRLKMICSIYNVMSNASENEIYNKGILLFHEELTNLKKAKNINESQIFLDILLYGVNEAAIQVLLIVVPQFISYYKSGEFVEIVWKEISNLMTCQNANVRQSRILLIMCYFFNLCFEDPAFKDGDKLMALLFNDEIYWNLIQLSLVEKDPMMRKQGMYLFKKTIDLLKIKDLTVKCLSTVGSDVLLANEKMIFYWDVSFKNELSNIYTEIIITLEFLDEQQTHLIKPIFQMIEKLVQKCLDLHKKGQNIDLCWIILIFEKALMHESIQIAKWSLSNLLKLPEIFFSDEGIAKKTVCLLISTLNNLSIYYNEGLAVSKELTIFFEKMTKLKTGKIFFCVFIKEICNFVWSPEALFFVVHSLSPIQKYSFWGEEEILEIKKFVSKAFKTHNKIIRTGIQCELLNAIIGLTDEKNVTLEKILLLLSSFSEGEALKQGSKAWERVLDWLRSAYSQTEAEKILENYECGNLCKEFNEKSIAFIFILFYSVYGAVTSEEVKYIESNFVVEKLSKILLSFKGAEKRLYCDTSIYDHYLTVICHIYERSHNHSMSETLLKYFPPFLSDIFLYIKRRFKQISNLQDFDACQIYIKTFEALLKNFKKHDSVEVINNIILEALTDLEQYQSLKIPSIRIYCWLKFLRAVFKTSFTRVEPPMPFILYLLKEANEPLQKDDSNSEETKDVLTLWGRMNSEFLEAKWQLLEHFINNNIILYGSENRGRGGNWVDNGDLVKFSIEALNIGGYGVLCPVMSVLRNVLFWESDAEVKRIVSSIWKVMVERRKTDEFKLFIKLFVEMLFREEFILKGASAEEILMEYADLIFSDSSITVVNIFVKHIQKMEISQSSISLLCHLVGKGIIFGPVQRKDERLTIQVCYHIELFGICKVSEYNTSNEVRARAFQKILTLDKNVAIHKLFARNLIETLQNMENDMNRNRTRYFGDSHVHRVKHRVMQALLILEPLLYPNQEVAEELARWLYGSLMTQNPQPSVKYQQEWLLIRLLIKYPLLLNNFWGYFSDSVEKKTKGICTLIAVSHHLFKLLSPELTAEWVDKAIPTFLPFCMDQHFEVRLYAQVVLQKLYELAKGRKLKEILEKYETVNECVSQSIERGCKGNAGKNCIKLQEDFYLNIFHPVEHYSLETIFVDLPRLANVGSDEWISTEVFTNCGVDPSSLNIMLQNADNSLQKIDSARWSVEKSHPGVLSEFNDDKSEEYLGNFQKKIIPVKSLLPGLDEVSCDDVPRNDTTKKDGLIVVASLIDRIPNLGGLVRTCEIFGASEYIVNSLKYIEDKQFTSLSVTAEKWITVKEVKSQNLLEYVMEMKAAGYTVIGAEQALYSQPLSRVKFPKKSLLLLGNEKEGIPPNLLPLLDVCVEIPQVGIIRSLNVHVTGALFIWEYAKQNYFST